MKKPTFATILLSTSLTLPSIILPNLANASTDVNHAQINACVAQMTEKKITDNKSAQKVCGCVVKEQAKITQKQKNELDDWVKSGKDIRTNKTFQNISDRMKACGNGIIK
ncbi:hypothetical protein MOMA_07111 [Moraxella macacae 0408225]|uniref:Uncharacterized protein n=1 Tax=Moraxella macacae 0408225 TaxID=1230338 RepID=L2F5K7_9GAMM|nr:hypothetical protein [Moraxella macacae]ELA08312.1 hypothetical protein MOMA_07111 [Moraxella macacae 0408225]